MGVKSYLLLKHMNEREGHCGCKTSIFKIVFPVKVGYTIDVMDANIDMFHLNSKVFKLTMFNISNTTYLIGIYVNTYVFLAAGRSPRQL